MAGFTPVIRLRCDMCLSEETLEEADGWWTKLHIDESFFLSQSLDDQDNLGPCSHICGRCWELIREEQNIGG